MQPQYRAHAQQQAPQRSPHAPNQRRGGIGPIMSSGPHPTIPLTHAQIAHQQQAQAHASELAKRRSRKPTDKNIPDGVEDIIVDPEASRRYGQLRDVERLLDATTTRKRLELFDGTKSTTKLRRTLRIWISNTVEDQIWQGDSINADSFDFTPAMEASYRVKVEGRLLDEPDDLDIETSAGAADEMQEDGAAPLEPKAKVPPHRFSHFIKSLSIDFDRSRFRNGAEQSVEWKKPDAAASRNQGTASLSAAADFDEITFKRNGDENMNVTINLYRHEVPERYQLSPELADVVDMTEATQHEAVTGLWEYIRLFALQEDEEKRNFRCDDLLRKVVRQDSGTIPMLPEYVMFHLQPLPPISLPYTIRVDEAFHKNPQPTIYDVQVLVDDPSRAALRSLLNNPDYANMLREVHGLDEQLARLIQAICVSKAKHSFFATLAAHPADFVNSWLSSQKRDLDVIMGEGNENATDDWRRGGTNIWASQNARESVNVLLSRQR